MDLLIQQVVNGIMIGSTYAVVAIGLLVLFRGRLWGLIGLMLIFRFVFGAIHLGGES